MSNTIDYRLAKHAVLRRFFSGELPRVQVCDAHPELLRAAVHFGMETNEPCPICQADARQAADNNQPTDRLAERTPIRPQSLTSDRSPARRVDGRGSFQGPRTPIPTLVTLTWLYGDALRQKNGHLVEDLRDLSDFKARYNTFTAWTVECCIACGWNHVIARQYLGSPTAERSERAAMGSMAAIGLKVVDHD